jgi:KDO2-lipid IV(A) lauroyltransferase
VELFSKDDNPLGMASFLRRGGVLGVLSDQRAGSIGELVPFFGRLTSCTPIPAILARRTGAAVVGISLRTVATGRWELRFHALDEAAPSTVNVMGLVERMMRVSPADVFWLQERWKISSSEPHRQNGKVARGEIVPATKRRRALLWAGEGGVLPPAPVAVPDDVDYEVTVSGDSAVEGEMRSHRYNGGSILEFLQQVDAAGDQPLDYVVGGGSRAADVARACDRLGLGWLEAGA